MSRLHDIAAGVAPLLEGQWRYNRLVEESEKTHHRHRATLNDDTLPRRQILFSSIWNRPERIEISGRLPARTGKTRITVGQGRNIPAIAADIERRFLPGYLTEWIQAEACQRQRAACKAHPGRAFTRPVGPPDEDFPILRCPHRKWAGAPVHQCP